MKVKELELQVNELKKEKADLELQVKELKYIIHDIQETNQIIVKVI